MVIHHKLILDMVPSSSEDITRAMRGQLKLPRTKRPERHCICFNFVS